MRYLRGHMGGDEVIVVAGSERTAGREREIARRVLAHPSVRALEMVFVQPGPRGPAGRSVDLRLRMVDSTTRDYLAVCGGVTQVLGRVLSRQDHLDFLGLPVEGGLSEYRLRTDRYRLPIRIEPREPGVGVQTCMKEVARDWLEGPHFDLEVSGTPAGFMGEFILVEHAGLAEPGDAARREACELLAELHREVARRTGAGLGSFYAASYRKIGELRYRTRFVFWPPPRIEHFACGSGSTALALRLALACSGAERERAHEYRFEVACDPPGRLGETRVRLHWRDGALETARFSHDRVELLGRGSIGLDPLEIREEEEDR